MEFAIPFSISGSSKNGSIMEGAQGLFKIKPDLTTLGKIIGGGMPVGAVGGRQDIMDCLSPLGAVYQAGDGHLWHERATPDSSQRPAREIGQ